MAMREEDDAAIDALARTIYGEARGESVSGQEAVANVVLNRLAVARKKGRYWWGSSITEICKAPYQFSCWNAGDPNAEKIRSVDGNDHIFGICRRIAARAVSGLLEDNTRGATHYHARSLRPKWSIGRFPCAEIGAHIFYNDVEG